ncbi:RNA polymerase sigma factor [Rhizobium etli]|uniref:RNA polymerase sigma factor n=1 Tax=Rhizobium etli TaxID=29449 RepID=A0A7W6ZK45_RHIET|nr:RNA polymerase sigma factor [Rhizobium etli]MBB4481178.1 RNA polymerase sigma-70 factor (ECF subfamily) [Rhizobium etli]MBB4537207.1 RNA polymerase sigma-70 factor (ECF subfamily) [Rhizobium etli]
MIAIPVPAAQHRPDISTLSDADLVPLAKMGDEPAIRVIVQRHNRRLFRTARAVIRNDAEAEDVVQAAYIKAFTSLAAFRGDAQLSTWLTRIVLNEAMGRVRVARNTTGLEEIDMQRASWGGEVLQFPSSLSATDPETELSRSQARHLLEHAVDELPDDFRAVFVLREVEDMSTEEAASCLGIKPGTVKTRLHRARKMMRQSIEKQLSGAFAALFPFGGARCAFIADRVIAALRNGTSETD